MNCLLGLVPERDVHESERGSKAALNRIRHHVMNANLHAHKSKITRSTWDIGFIQARNSYVKCFEQAMRKVLGHCKLSYVQSFCDATHFYRVGIPTLLFGPGRMELGHSSNEYVSIRQVKDATSVLAYAVEGTLYQ